MTDGQLPLDFAPAPGPGDELRIRPGEQFPSMEGMRTAGISVAAFYWCCSELRAGRPLPMPLNDTQRAYISRWAP